MKNSKDFKYKKRIYLRMFGVGRGWDEGRLMMLLINFLRFILEIFSVKKRGICIYVFNCIVYIFSCFCIVENCNYFLFCYIIKILISVLIFFCY